MRGSSSAQEIPVPRVSKATQSNAAEDVPPTRSAFGRSLLLGVPAALTILAFHICQVQVTQQRWRNDRRLLDETAGAGSVGYASSRSYSVLSAPNIIVDSPGPSKLAIIQWTHTLRNMPMLLTARRQIEQRAHAEHHVVLSACGPLEHNCSQLMKAAQPLIDNVTCVSSFEVASSFPAFKQVNAVFKANHIFHNFSVGNENWCWNSCDGPYVYWYARIGQKLRHIHFFWFLEWDVVWTGHIVTILDAFSANVPVSHDLMVEPANPSMRSLAPNELEARTRKPETPDMLCANPASVTPRWPHQTKRDKHALPMNVTFHCVTEIFRMTHRLLERIVAFSRVGKHALFCEMRAATVCAAQPWCRMRSLFDPQHAHLLHTAATEFDPKNVQKVENDPAALPHGACIAAPRTNLTSCPCTCACTPVCSPWSASNAQLHTTTRLSEPRGCSRTACARRI